jgi:Zn finger protein HypA/HybF involved in hydrogenase expression
MAQTQNDVHCPTCNKPMEKVPKRHQVYHCDEHGYFRKKLRRKPRSSFNPNDSSTWTARCDECGGKMEYGNLAYHCMKCGNYLQV